MGYFNDGSIGNWACYLYADGSLACCVQLHQRGPEHRSGRVATRGFDSPEEAFHYLHVTLNQPVENIRFFVSSPEQFLLTQCLAGPKLPMSERNIAKGLAPIDFQLL
jgi:hypothetical protein